jgi:hypothetical protein
MLITRGRAEKEELISNFVQSLKTENDYSTSSAQVSGEERLQTAKTCSNKYPTNNPARVLQSTPSLATSSSETIPEKLDTTGETTLEAECEHTESIPSPGKLKPLFQSLFRENTSELLNDAPLRQPTKRRKLDEIDALYQPALERVEALKTHLLQSQACDKSVAALIDRLESDNERLRTDLDASRQQANSSSQLEAEIKKLTSDHAKLKTELGDSQAKVKHQTKKIKTLMGKNTDLQAQVKSLQSTNQDLTLSWPKPRPI